VVVRLDPRAGNREGGEGVVMSWPDLICVFVSLAGEGKVENLKILPGIIPDELGLPLCLREGAVLLRIKSLRLDFQFD
jgi:hypothetical protein